MNAVHLSMFHVFKPRQLLVCLHKCHRMHKLKYAVSNMICKIDDSLLKSLKILDNRLKYLFSFDIKIVLCMTMLLDTRCGDVVRDFESKAKTR